MIGNNELDLWNVDLSKIDTGLIQKLYPLLSIEEMNRASRFHFKQDSRHFILRRCVLRIILSQYLDIPPEKICYSYSQAGKPSLCLNKEGSLNFNLSHSKDMVSIAITRDTKIGVDLEFMDKKFPFLDILNLIYSRSEMELMKQLPKNNQAKFFWRLWTAKEAYLKGIGTGLMEEPSQVSFSQASIANYSQNLELDTPGASPWKFITFSPTIGYMLTLAVQAKYLPVIKKRFIECFTLCSEFYS